jgi:hypothetical protein
MATEQWIYGDRTTELTMAHRIIFYSQAFLVSVFLVFALSAADAAPLAAPQGEVILTVTGNIHATNAGDTAQFDLDMLRDIDGTEIATTTIWTDGVRRFKGVSLLELVNVLGVSTGTLLASAIDDYTVSIPVSDAVKGGPIIAYLLDGNTMSIRGRGPLWVIYPYDQKAEYRSEVTYTRSIWQLDRIEVSD